MNQNQFSWAVHKEPYGSSWVVWRNLQHHHIEWNSWRLPKVQAFLIFSEWQSKQMLTSLQPASTTTWEECRSTFLNQFYTMSRSNLLRKKIHGFRKGHAETLSDAWEWFQDYERDCLHHGFTETHILSIFYRGMEQKSQLSLDTTSNGDFSTKSIRESRVLVNNLAASSSNNCSNFNATTRPDSHDSNKIDELKAMVSFILKNQQCSMSTCEGWWYNRQFPGRFWCRRV